MKSLLALLMVLVVSGDDGVTINGIIEDRVLLPCPCPNRNMTKEFRWQRETPNKKKIFIQNHTGSFYLDKDRMKTFEKEDNYNCSLLLSNITADDQGTYKCSFTHITMYTFSYIHLNVSAHYSVCQHPVTKEQNSLRAECDVEGPYRDTEVLWYLDKQILTNSTKTTIIHKYTPKAPTHHRFSSNIITKFKGTSEPKCDVKARGISAVISNNCERKPEKYLPVLVPTCYKRYFKVIPIVLVIGVSLILVYRSHGFTMDEKSGGQLLPVVSTCCTPM